MLTKTTDSKKVLSFNSRGDAHLSFNSRGDAHFLRIRKI